VKTDPIDDAIPGTKHHPAEAAYAEAAASGVKMCSIDDPECEACQ
jgi:ribonucleoside-diphosphate reductase alpha chain